MSSARITKQELVRKYSSAINLGSASLFIGSGISAGLDKVQWRELLTPASEDLGIDIKTTKVPLPEIAQFWVDKEVTNRRILIDRIDEKLKGRISEPKYKNSAYKQICHLNIRNIWTTNYDELITDAYEVIAHNKRYKTLDTDQDILNLSGQEDVRIYQMHGSLKNPDSMIVTSDDYFNYETKHKFFTHSLKSQLLHNTFLFIGFSFDDENVKSIMQTLQNQLSSYAQRDDSIGPHYLILYSDPEKTEEECNLEKYKINSLSKMGIKTLTVPPDNNEIINTLLQIKKYSSRNNIVVAGSSRKEDSPWYKITDLSKAIGKKLMVDLTRQYNLHTCYGDGVGKNCIESALDTCSCEYIMNGNDRIRIWPTYETEETTDENKGKIYKQRESMIKNAAACIFLGGKEGTYSEYIIAKNELKFCIPIGISGGCTKIKIIPDFDKYYDSMCEANNIKGMKKELLKEYINKMKTESDVKTIIEYLFLVLDCYYDEQFD